MEFRIDKHANLPLVEQLQEQIKIALLLGRLRPGDTLSWPSPNPIMVPVSVSCTAVAETPSSSCMTGNAGR